jgi:hypothetical protein
MPTIGLILITYLNYPNLTPEMKLKSLTLILLCLSVFGATSCSSDSAKKKQSKKPTSAKKMLPANDYWALAKDNLGLTKIQVDGIKKVSKKYSGQITKLKKAKKWDGKANAKTRTTLQKNKAAELKKLLGNKLPLYNKFATKNGIKVARKKVNKPVKKKASASKKKAAKKVVKKPISKKKKTKK